MCTCGKAASVLECVANVSDVSALSRNSYQSIQHAHYAFHYDVGEKHNLQDSESVQAAVEERSK